MKYSLYLLFSIIFLLCVTGNSAQAGFVVKKHAAVAAPAQVHTSSEVAHHSIFRKEQNVSLFTHIKHILPLFGERGRPSEWLGIAALVCGLVGLFAPGVNLLAILFGVLGMGRKCNAQGLATTGFILGLLELLLFLLFGGITFVSLILL